MRHFFSACLGFPLLILAVCSCDRAQDTWQPTDLTRYNIPLTVNAPDSISVSTLELNGPFQDVTITSPDDPDFALQVLASDAFTNDLARLKADQLELVRDNRYFESIVEEEPSGFVYENKIDTLSIYGFRHIVYQGDREYILQNTFGSTLTLTQAQRLYTAVKQD